MSELLFNRAAMISFEAPKREGKEYEGLRVKFQVEKSEDSTPNTAKISVYNLSEDTRSYIQQKNTVVKLSVGYQGVLPRPLYSNIFTGAITKIKSAKDSGSIITSFESADGILNYTGNRVGKSYGPGTTVKQVFNDLASSLGLPLASITGIRESNKSFVRGYSVSGLTRDELDKICARTGTVWSIQDGQLTVRPKNSASPQEVILLSPETGLLGIPNKGEEGAIEFVALLNTQIKPAQRVQISSQGINGIFRVTKVQYNGDTRSGDWNCTCEAKK